MSEDEKKSRQATSGYQGPMAELAQLNSRELALAIQKMNTGQKKLLATKGNASIRKILLRDPNVEVQLAVVQSPKTTESEVERIAALPATAEIVLKTISANAKWMRSYRIKLGLAKNPKTPAGVATRCLRSLTTHDLKKISGDPYVKKAVAQSAQRMLKTRR